MRKLDGYIIRAILGPVALVTAVVLILSGLFLFIGQQDDIGHGSYTVFDAAKYVLLNLPEQAWALLPVSALIGALMGLGALARGSEITVIRAAGISPRRIAVSALMAAVVLIILEVALGEFIAPHLQQAARQNKAFSKNSEITIRRRRRGVGEGRQPHHQRRTSVRGAAVRRDDGVRAVARSSPERRSVMRIAPAPARTADGCCVDIRSRASLRTACLRVPWVSACFRRR